MDRYLIKYLRDNSDSELSKKYIDFFKIELDWHIYNGESHISNRYHRNKKITAKEHAIKLVQNFYAILAQTRAGQSGATNVLSALFSPVRADLIKMGFDLYSPVWTPVGKKNIFGDLKTIQWRDKIEHLVRNGDFYLFLEPKLHVELEDFQQHLLAQYQKKDFRALLLGTDQHFYSKYAIDIFKKMQRPSFVFSHGLPALYSKDAEDRANYLMVWGEKVKQNYINAGFESSKIHVVGHPVYKNIPKKQELKFDLSDILVIPVSSSIYHQHMYDETILTDKSMAVLYLYQVQYVLKRLGVKYARYRVHPATNKQWIHKFLDHDFYIQDTETLNNSLSKTSLVIGATSTVLLEALIQGVNYMVFEPKDELGNSLTNQVLVPPFDGSESKLPVANNENELEQMLKERVITDYSLVHDYIQKLDLSVIKELIG